MNFPPILDEEINIDQVISTLFGVNSTTTIENGTEMLDNPNASFNAVDDNFNNTEAMALHAFEEGHINSSEMTGNIDVIADQRETMMEIDNYEESNPNNEMGVDQNEERRRLERLRVQSIRARQRRERDEGGPKVDEMSRDLTGEHYLGSLQNKKCGKCRAYLFEAEIPRGGSASVSVCCQKGKVRFDCFDDYPDQKIRTFNNALAMASVAANMPLTSGSGPPTLAVQGAMSRQMGTLVPPEGRNPSFAQYYVMDPDEAADRRLETYDCDAEIMRYFSSLFLRKNVLAQSYRMMSEVMREEQQNAENEGTTMPEIRMSFVTSRDLDLRRYNEPTANEVAIVYVVNDEAEIPPPRFLTVYDKNRRLRTISELNALCDPLAYPIIYPTGRKGWEPEMRANVYSSSNIRLTQREYYAFILFTRNQFNALHYCRRLFQQYIIDAYLKVEGSRLRFYRNNQDQFRMESLAGLTEFLEGNERNEDVGRRIILPRTFVGSPRCMKTSYQDAMAIVGKFGKPDLFITFTANPQWKEIEENLLPDQMAADRPDLVARVFQHKMNALLCDIKKNNLFGAVAAYIAVVEWQKRGLPHCHILLSLQNQDKIRTAYQADRLIKAEIPDSVANPDLYSKVTKHMMHRVCYSLNGESAPCYVSVNGQKGCSKKFPKAFCEHTQLNESSYPCYRRRNDGRFIFHNNVKIDNRYVVPYSPYLLRKYNSHINVEVCGMIKAVKYLYKYVYKGHDRARLRLENRMDEITSYVDGRYICAPEAVHRILGYSIENRSHSVKSLHVHEDNDRMIRFQTGQEQEAVDRANEVHSTLEAWFELNKNENNCAYDVDLTTLLYSDIPKYFLFASGKWLRKKNMNKPVIGRLQFVMPQQVERFALRILLLHRPNMKSFSDLRTVHGRVFDSFSDAAKALGLLQNDEGYHETLAEAASFHMPFEMRKLFAMLIGYNDITEVKKLWDAFKMEFAEDFIYDGYEVEMALAKVYYAIEEDLNGYGKSLESFLERPRISQEDIVNDINTLSFLNEANRLIGTLNEQQREVFETITNEESRNKLFFVDGPGGSGKTYLYNTLYNYLMGRNKKIICVAWTGIAALLLPRGRTCHSVFKLPLDFSCTFLGMNRNSKEAMQLKEVDVIIWDEISMVPGKALYYVNDMLKYIMGGNKPFGGKTIVCGGDFRQTLPIQEAGLSAVASSVKGLGIWGSFIKMSLSENMRVSNDNEWISFLLDVGVGKNLESTIGKIFLPPSMFTDNIVKSVFGDNIRIADIESLSSRVILAPKNISVNHLNDEILEILEGESRSYHSIDTIVDNNDLTEQINVEFLHCLNPSGFPPAKLTLKVGAVIILLRNLNISNGLANGTRLMVTKMDDNILRAKILTGSRFGTEVLIPKISLICDRNFSIKFKRYQFPVKLSFAMSINKSQGQTFSHVGIYLLDPVFSHGQLYVALSRCSSKKNIYIKSHETNIVNVVEKGIFQ